MTLEIRNVTEFEKLQPIFEKRLDQLSQIWDVRVQSKDQSTVQTWINVVNLIKSFEKDLGTFEDDIKGFSMIMLYCYKLMMLISEKCKTMQMLESKQEKEKESIGMKSAIDPFLMYEGLFRLANRLEWEKLTPKDSKIIAENLSNYLQSSLSEFGKQHFQQDSDLIKDCVLWVEKIYQRYHYVEKTIFPSMYHNIKICDPYLLNDNLPNEKIYSAARAALILEHLGYEYGESLLSMPNLIEMQNRVVALGVSWAEERNPLFSLGAQDILAAMLSLPRSLLVAAFLTERLIEEILETKKIIDVNSLKIQCKKYFESFKARADKLNDENMESLIKNLTEPLQRMKATNNLSENAMNRMIEGLKAILTMYHHFKPQLGKNFGNVVLVLGDSVIAGVLVSPDCAPIPQFQQLLKERDLPCQVAGCAIPGLTTTGSLSILPACLGAYQKIIMFILETGGNNIYGKEPTEERVQEIINDIIGHFKIIQPLGIPMVYAVDVPETFPYSHEWRKAFEGPIKKALVEKGILVIIKEGGLLKKAHMFKPRMPDENLHPNEEGAQLIASHFMNELEQPLRDALKHIQEDEMSGKERKLDKDKKSVKEKEDVPKDLFDVEFNLPPAYRNFLLQQEYHKLKRRADPSLISVTLGDVGGVGRAREESKSVECVRMEKSILQLPFQPSSGRFRNRRRG